MNKLSEKEKVAERNIATSALCTFLLTMVVMNLLISEDASWVVRMTLSLGCALLSSGTVLYGLQAVTGIKIFEPFHIEDEQKKEPEN